MRGSSASLRKPQMLKAPTIVSRAHSLRSVERERVDIDPLRAAFQSASAAEVSGAAPPGAPRITPMAPPVVPSRSGLKAPPVPPSLPARPVAPAVILDNEPHVETAETIAAEMMKGVIEGPAHTSRRTVMANPLHQASTETMPLPSGSRSIVAGVLDFKVIRELIRQGDWAPALRRTQRALAELSGTGSRNLELRLYETQALVQLHRYADAQSVLRAVGIDAAKTGSDGIVPEDPSATVQALLPFALRVLGAEMPYYCARDVHATCSHLQRLLDLLQSHRLAQHNTQRRAAAMNNPMSMRVELMLGEEAVQPLGELTLAQIFHWQRRLLILLAGHVNDGADGTQHSVMYCMRAARIADAAAASKLISPSDRAELVVDAWCHAARLLVRGGNVEGAETLFKNLKEIVPAAVFESPQMRVERCNLLVLNNKYAEALEELDQVLRLPLEKLQQASRATNSGQDVLLVASNNMAIAALHCCEIRRAVDCLEVFLRGDIRHRLHSVLIFNLCTLYEVAFDGHISQMRKSALRIVAQKLGLQATASDFRL